MAVKFVIADQNAVSAEGHFRNYTDALARAAQALGCDVTVLWNKRFPLESHSATYRMEAVFSCTEAEAAARRLIDYGEGHFGFELDRALQCLGLGAQDHVVVHTCHFVELVEALDYIATLPPARDLPTFHIVVRYDPDVYRYRMHKLMRRLGAILRTPHLKEKLRLHSDTQQLASEFTKLFGTTVDVCPIPVDLDGLHCAAARTAGLTRGSLVATYLGTARSEKGYADILEAIAFLQKDHISTNRLHFVLQCSERSILGEPGLVDYQRKLETFIAENGLEGSIRLVRHMVEQDEYCDLVAQSDIVLLAYSPESYRYRSSGVLIEAMAAGKVVVTREGSWMASRVGPDNAICYADPAGLGPALAQAIERFDDLDRGAKALQAEAITSGDPVTLARHFLQNGVSAGATDAVALRPVGIELLAGPVDGFELVASADPRREDLRIDNRSLARTQRRYDPLLQLESVDVLLHCPDAGSARWFFEEVYMRFLADRHVTVLAIGEIDAGLEADGFISVGPVANRDPLYAAAKMVVASQREADGAPLAVSEALASAKPTLFFGVATTGLQKDGIEIRNDAGELASAIIDLLESSAPLVEWSPLVRAANRLVRSCLADEPLDCSRELAAAPSAVELVTLLSEALVGDCRAPLLAVDGGLLASVVQRQLRGGAAEVIRLSRIAINAVNPAHAAEGASSFAVNRLFPTRILLTGVPGDGGPTLRSSMIALERTGERPGAVWGLRDEDPTGPELVSVDVTGNVTPSEITVWQDIPLTSKARVFGRPVFVNWSFDGQGPMVQERAPPAGAVARAAQRLGLRVQSLLNGWAPWTTANQLFDAQWYLAAYPEASSAGVEPFRHYERHGAARGYKPNPFFDPDWYAARYGTGVAGAWQHYLQFGHDPQFDPGPHFSAALYLRANPDVAGSWQWSPLLHYTLLGRGEGREILPAELLRPVQSLILPMVIGAGGEHWVEFLFDRAPGERSPIVLHLGEFELDIATSADPAGTIARARLPREAAVSGVVRLQVSLSAGERPVAIKRLRAGWTFVC